MNKGKLHFGIGLIVGIIITSVFFHFYAPRYTAFESNGILTKHDKWSGDSWQFIGGQWKEVTSENRDWDKIDSILRNELHLPDSGSKTMDYLRLIQNEHADLRNLGDEELLDRMGQVYLREVMTNNYLTSYSTLQKVKEMEEQKKDK